MLSRPTLSASGRRYLAKQAAKPLPQPTFDPRKRPVNKPLNEEKLVEDGAPTAQVGEFRRLHIWQLKETGDDRSVHKKKREAGETPQEERLREMHRAKTQSPDQDWPSVWPTATTFKPSAVPLPVRMGYRKDYWRKPPPDKYWNKELMKIPNFLHLTPPAIERHAEALKQFCTPWPEGLSSDEERRRHFPLTVTRTDYVHASPSIRDERARKVQIQINLNDLPLKDTHARNKFIRLVGAERYDHRTDLVTIQADRCPTRKQNREYVEYLLTVLCGESNLTESWESGITRDDALSHSFHDSDGLQRWLNWSRQWLAKDAGARPKWLQDVNADISDEELQKLPQLRFLADSWEKATNAERETDEQYMELWSAVNQATEKLMGLKPFDDLR